MAKMSKRAKRSEVVDRLSSLPDDILINNILRLLPMREAARTSVLSHRWRSLFLCIPRMDLDASEKAVLAASRRGKGGGAVSKFVDWVDRVMGAYKEGSATLCQFCLYFPLDKNFSTKIQSWLEFSLGKGVEVLEIDLCRDLSPFENPEFPSFPPHLFPNLRVLRSLTLGGVSITSASLDHLLRGCVSLESLKIHRFTSLTEVNITGPTSRLKSIEILGYYAEFKSIMISAPTPDLVLFTYPDSPILTLHIEHAPRLVNLNLGENAGGFVFDLTSHPLFRYVSQLETLHLRIRSWDKAVHWLPHLCNLNCLKQLKLTLDGLYYEEFREQRLRGLVSVIEAASATCVQHLTLDVSILRMKLNIREELDNLQSLQHLRVIEIVGFRAQNVVYDLSLRLIKSAPSLEKFIFDCRHPLQQGCVLDKYDRSKSTIQKWKKDAKKIIQPKLPSNAELLLI